MLEGTPLKTAQHRKYLEKTLKQTEDSILGLKGQLKMQEDYVLWLKNELAEFEDDPKT